jgi:hypothetical protein
MYPKASIKMLSNSRTQKIFIDGVCKEKGFGNVEVITGDFTKFDFEEKEQYVLATKEVLPLTSPTDSPTFSPSRCLNT